MQTTLPPPYSGLLYYEYKALKTHELNTLINTAIGITQTSSDEEIINRVKRNAQVAAVVLCERTKGK